MRQLRIYLSSTFDDLKVFRIAVLAKLKQARLNVVAMEAYAAADERPLDKCLRDVAESDIYVGIFAWRYGYTPPEGQGNPDGKSITHLEYCKAQEKQLRKLLFFAHPDTKANWPRPDRFIDEISGEGERGRKLNRIRQELGSEKLASFFRTPEELATLVLAAIMDSGKSDRVYNIQPVAPGLVSRIRQSKAIVDALVGPGDGVPGACTVISGAGGFGKTTLASEACHAAELVAAFPDGLLWTVLGEKPDPTRVLSDLYAVVTNSRPTVAGVEEIVNALGRALAGRRCLIVVDDVWRLDDLSLFLRLVGPMLLVTTRVQNLVEATGQTGWKEVPVDEMEVSEAAALLARGLAPDESALEMLVGLAEQLGSWPLLLDLANKRLREENRSSPGRLPECIARVVTLFHRKGVLGFDRRDSEARNAAVKRSVEVGLEKADQILPGLAAKAIELGIFPEDVTLPPRVLAELWAIDAIDVEEEVLAPLDNLSLVRWDRLSGDVRLHDMIRRAFEALVPNSAEVHLRMVEAWGDPRHLPHAYAWRWFGWHCIQAGQPELLRTMLLDLDWLKAQVETLGVDVMLADLNRLRDDSDVALLLRACQQSGFALAHSPSQIAGQLLARIPKEHESLRQRLLDRALAWPNPWLRPVTASLATEQALRWGCPASEGTLTHVAFSANGCWAAHFESGARRLRQWNLNNWNPTNGQFAILERRNVYAIATSDDGHWCLCADSLGVVYRLGREGERWEGHAHHQVTIADRLAISANGKRALSACMRGKLVAWDIEQDSYEVVWGEGDDRAVAITLDAAGKTAVVARRGGRIEHVDLWPARRRTLCTLSGEPTAIARTADGAILAIADKSGLIELRSASESAIPPSRFATDHTPTALALSKDGRYLAIGFSDGTVEIRVTGASVPSARYLRGHQHAVDCIAFGRDERRVISADLLQVKEWALESVGTGVHPQVLGAVAVSPDGQRAVGVLDDGRLGSWNLRDGSMQASWPPKVGPRFSQHSSNVPRRIERAAAANRVLVWNDRLLSVWDLDQCEEVGALLLAEVRDATITPQGDSVVFIDGYEVRLWSIADRTTNFLGTYKDDDPCSHIAVSPDGKFALSAGGSRDVVLWRLDEELSESERALLDLFRQRGMDTGFRDRHARVSSCSINSRDKPNIVVFSGPRTAVVGTGDGRVFEVDVSTPLQPVARPLDGKHPAWISDIAISEDTEFVLSASTDLQLRDRLTGAVLLTLPIHARIGRLCVERRQVLILSASGELVLVRLTAEDAPVSFRADRQFISCDADAMLRWIVAVDQGGQLHFFHAEPGAPHSEASAS